MAPLISIEPSDSLVALLAWGITWAARRYAPPELAAIVKKASPTIAVIAALFILGFIEAVTSGDVSSGLNTQVFVKAVIAGAVAVLGHSQMREAMKKDREVVAPPESLG